MSKRAVVEMVGAGPGDPDLMTLRAEAALAAATVVVTDAAVAHLVRTFGPAARAVVSAGGGTDHATVTRAATVDGDTIAVLVGAARRGERAVRLYRGDPWLHPAYAVESAMLAAFGIELVTVPGPAAELALPTAAGIPVHDRSRSATVTVASPAALPPATDPTRTLVTATDDAAELAAGMSHEGGRPDLAVVAAFGGEVSVHRGTPREIAAAPAVGPGVVVVGAVARPASAGAEG